MSSPYDRRSWPRIITSNSDNRTGNNVSTPPPITFVNGNNNPSSATMLGNTQSLGLSSSMEGELLSNQQYLEQQQQLREMNSNLRLNLRHLNDNQPTLIMGGSSPSNWGYFLPPYISASNVGSSSSGIVNSGNNNAFSGLVNTNHNFAGGWALAAPAPFAYRSEAMIHPGVHVPFINCNDPLAQSSGSNSYSHQQQYSAAAAESQGPAGFHLVRSPTGSTQKFFLATPGISPVMVQKPNLVEHAYPQQATGNSKKKEVPRAAPSVNVDETKRPSRKRSVPDESSKSEVSSTTSTAASVSTPKSTVGLGGERRLSISFLDLGRCTHPIQTFGKSRLRIPDGLCGLHVMYSQKWKFEINYIENLAGSTTTIIAWSITNIASNTKLTVQETPLQAQERQLTGKTVCNFAMKQAMQQRLRELNEMFAANNPSKTDAEIASLTDIINKLTPKHFIDGLLFFGLRHTIVQEHQNQEQG